MGIRRRGKKFLVTVELGLDEHGVRRRKCVTCSTERAAEAIEAQLKAEIARNAYVHQRNGWSGDSRTPP
jgi:hypothetical protein